MTTVLNNAQIEILKLFASDLSETELQDLRRLLIEFRYKRLQQAIASLDPTEEQIKSWGDAHDRTPYKSQLLKNKKLQ